MRPGEKIAPGEAPERALIRELNDALQIDLRAEDIVSLGQFIAIAANNPGHLIVAEMLSIKKIRGEVLPAADIEGSTWFTSGDNHLSLSPLTVNKIVPLLRHPEAISGEILREQRRGIIIKYGINCVYKVKIHAIKWITRASVADCGEEIHVKGYLAGSGWTILSVKNKS